MLLSALDPALLFYKVEDWQDRKPHCFDRFRALALHFRVTREYGQKIAMSDTFDGLIWQFFPWNANFKNISELRDLRQVMFSLLQRVERINTKMVGALSLEPVGIVCKYVEVPEVIGAWEELLCGCVDETGARFDPQIATWETPAVRQCQSISLTIFDPEAETDTQYNLPLVWDDDSWATQLVKQYWWPDLQRCVELEFRTNPGIRSHSMAREQQIPFECSRKFRESLDQFCNDKQLQSSLVRALTKKVHGIHNAGLGDEQIGEIRRFRVTDFWRVHYRMEGNQLVLLEFGPHDIGGIG